MTRHTTRGAPPQRRQLRELIAQSAARLIAEDGMQDYAVAKRKAARQIGLADIHDLPSDTEVEEALRAYQELYQKDEQPARLKYLRQEALSAMYLLERFTPYLTGSVLSGTATRHSDINLHLYTDNVKDVELFLLNRDIPYETGETRYRFNDELFLIPTYTFQGKTAEIRVSVFCTSDLRANHSSGKAPDRAKIRQVEALLGIA